MQGNGKIERDYSKARSLFERSISFDDLDATANYNLGLLSMLGLGQEGTNEKDITKAMAYFEKISDKDPAAMNAIGVLYYQAPDVFETDPVKLHGWGGFKRDIKKSWKFLENAATKGSLHANFNLGALHLDPKDKDNFSLSKAYEKFKVSAMQGHTISSYNVGVMHFLGLGTFKSCQVSIAFFKHVLQMGEQAQKMKQAYKLVKSEHYREAAIIYMELAEMGYGIASLNLALLLEKNDVFRA